jgi:RND family efflux transporter MFP subunit
MDYVPVYADEAGAPPKSADQQAEDFFADETPGAPKKERTILFYRNPMNPAITSPVPAKDEMGMDYLPVYSDEAGSGGGGTVSGLATGTIGEEGSRLAGVRTAPAVRERVGREVRTVGSVVPDETRVRRVQTKVEGWVENLHVNFTGQSVRKGDPILGVYSPDLVSTQEEYLRARQAAERLAGSSDPEARAEGQRLRDSARRRLELFDVPASFIGELEKSGTAHRDVTLLAPVGGYVTAKEIVQGQKIEPGMELYTITDLSRVWVEADVYESEAREVTTGTEATISLPYDPGKGFPAKVAYVQPWLNEEARTLRVRFDVPNASLYLKPGMYADVSFSLGATEGVVIPDSAVMDSGVRQVVFVDRGEGRFEPREVTLGARSAGKALVLSGVSEGEKVVVRANFLLDSESRLRSVIEAMTGAAAGKP